MVEDQNSTKRRGLGMLATIALVGALLVPLGLAVTASSSAAFESCGESGVTQGPEGEVCCPDDHDNENGLTQGEGIDDICCADETTSPDRSGVTQGQDFGVKCCPDGTFGHWQWGGYAGQNLSYCEAPPYEPPATAPAPEVSPATAAPKKAAAAAKPTFTG